MSNIPEKKEVVQKSIQDACAEASRAVEVLQRGDVQILLHDIAHKIASTFASGKKLIVAGNGGSLCDALHLAEECTGYFREKRAALPAIALADPGHITCVGNDSSFHDIFSRGVEAHGTIGDLFLALSTSGNSENLRRAVITARERGLWTIAFLGRSGGVMKGMADQEFLVSGFPHSDRIQEVHMAALHIIVQAVEMILFP